LDVGQDVCLSSVKIAAHRNRVHPVRDWLDGLRWDGQMRSSTWLVDVMGCEDTPYVRAVGQAWLVSAVARIYNPGCKVDTVLVLEGKPGIFKSSVLRALVGEWFLEMSITDVANKDAMQTLRRKWIAEFPEIDGLSRAEQAHVKAYFSRQVDTYRASYGKGTRDYPRQTVFAATTNKEQYLVDETGGSGRRMWPVRCVRGDLGLAGSLREQLWAEARVRFEGGQEWHLRDPELRDLERSEQDARFRSDPWEQTIATWLAKPSDLGDKTSRGVSTADVMYGALGMDVAKRDHAAASRVGAILRRIGWMPSKYPELIDGARVRLYRPEHGAGTNGHTLWPMESSGVVPIEHELPGEDMFPPNEILR
jgi:putative DNA primase/helicase